MNSLNLQFESWARETGFSFGEDDPKIKEISSILETGQFKTVMRSIMTHFVPPETAEEIQRRVLFSELQSSSIPLSMRDEIGYCRNIKELNNRLKCIQLKAKLANLWHQFDETEKKVQNTLEKLEDISKEYCLKRKREMHDFRKCQSLRTVVDNLQIFIPLFQTLNNMTDLVADRNTLLNRAQDKLDVWEKKVRCNARTLDRNQLTAQLISRIEGELGLKLPESETPINGLRVLRGLHRLTVDKYNALSTLKKSLEEKEMQLATKLNCFDLKEQRAAVEERCSSLKTAYENSFIIGYIEGVNLNGLKPDLEYEEMKTRLAQNKHTMRDFVEKINFYTNISLGSYKESLKKDQLRIKREIKESLSRDIKRHLLSIPQSIKLEMELRQQAPGADWCLTPRNLQLIIPRNLNTATYKSIHFPETTDGSELLSALEADGNDSASDFFEKRDAIEVRMKAVNDVCDLTLQLLDYWKREVMSESLAYDKDYTELRQSYLDAVKLVVELEKEA